MNINHNLITKMYFIAGVVTIAVIILGVIAVLIYENVTNGRNAGNAGNGDDGEDVELVPLPVVVVEPITEPDLVGPAMIIDPVPIVYKPVVHERPAPIPEIHGVVLNRKNIAFK